MIRNFSQKATIGISFDVCWSLVAQAVPENEPFLSKLSIFRNHYIKIVAVIKRMYILSLLPRTVLRSPGEWVGGLTRGMEERKGRGGEMLWKRSKNLKQGVVKCHPWKKLHQTKSSN